jgi:hypothetical protein
MIQAFNNALLNRMDVLCETKSLNMVFETSLLFNNESIVIV